MTENDERYRRSENENGEKRSEGAPRVRRRIGRVERIEPRRSENGGRVGGNWEPKRDYSERRRDSYYGSQRDGELPGGRAAEERRGGAGYRSDAYQQRRSQEGGRGNSYGRTRNAEGGRDNSYNRGGRDARARQGKPQGGHPRYGKQKVLRYKEEVKDPNEQIRLNRFLANAGVCSRRDADKYIVAGSVKVNGEVVTELGTKVLRSDDVRFKGVKVTAEDKIYLLLNKPRGFVTTLDDPENRRTVMELVEGACPERIYPVGRLDRNTTGVLLFTNDGEMAAKLTHPQWQKKKIYHVFLDREISQEDIQKLLTGISLDDGLMQADAIEYAKEDDHTQLGVEIHSGRNRVVRRMFEEIGYHVQKLDRVYFAGLTKKNLKRGTWRFLTPQEVSMLRMGAFE